MSEFTDRTDEIASYVIGRMPEADRIRFERELNSNPELKEAVDDFRQFRLGLRLVDALSYGHVQPGQLAAFAEEPNRFERSVRRVIASHLETCASCREEVEFSRLAAGVEHAQSLRPRVNPLAGIIDWILTPNFALRPVYAMIALVVALMPLVYVQFHDQRIERRETIDVFPIGERGESSAQVGLHIPRGIELVTLRGLVPEWANQMCSFTVILDSESTVLCVRNQPLDGNSFALEFPASYLVRDGRYTLRVQPLSPVSGESMPFDFRLNVTHPK